MFKCFFYLLVSFCHKMMKSRFNMSTLTMDQIQQLVDERTKYRDTKEFIKADEIKKYLSENNVEVTDISYKLGGGSTWKVTDSTHSIMSTLPTVNQYTPSSYMDLCKDAYELKKQNILKDKDILYITQCYLPTLCPDYYNNSTKNLSVKTLYEDVSNPINIEMQGRKFVDAAFELSMAGVTHPDIYNILIRGTEYEILRVSKRKSTRAIVLLQFIEKLAVAGVRDQDFYMRIYDIIIHKLDQEHIENTENSTIIKTNNTNHTNNNYPRKKKTRIQLNRDEYRDYSLNSKRPLLWLWRYASKQRKSGNQMISNKDINLLPLSLSNSNTNSIISDKNNTLYNNVIDDINKKNGTNGYNNIRVNRQQVQDSMVNSVKTPINDLSYMNISTLFDDPTLPLIVDLGCGYGVSLLGLAYHDTQSINDGNLYDNTSKDEIKLKKKTQYNYIGCDMSERAIVYAQGISIRWSMNSYCQFMICDALSCIQWIKRQQQLYPLLSVKWISIHFPTPYNLEMYLSTHKPQLQNTFESSDPNRRRDNNEIDENNINDVTLLNNTNTTNTMEMTTNELIDDLPNNGTNSSSSSCGSSSSSIIGGGNSQLPMNMNDFLITSELIEAIYDVLSYRHISMDIFNTNVNKYSGSHPESSTCTSTYHKNTENTHENKQDNKCGYLYIQSNVEDVSIYVYDLIEQTSRHLSLSTIPNENIGISASNHSIDAVAVAPVEDGVLVDSHYEKLSDERRNPAFISVTESVMKQHSWIHILHRSEVDYSVTQRTERSVDMNPTNLEKLQSNSDVEMCNDVDASVVSDENTIDSNDGEEYINHSVNENNNHNNPISDSTNTRNTDDQEVIIQKRKIAWLTAGGRRAEGEMFLTASPLPSYSRTESETVCMISNKPVYRLLYTVNKRL